MSTVVNSFLSNELSSNRILFESQLPVFGEKGLFACQRTNKGAFSLSQQFNVLVFKQEQIRHSRTIDPRLTAVYPRLCWFPDWGGKEARIFKVDGEECIEL